jgi:hypothetical protein
VRARVKLSAAELRELGLPDGAAPALAAPAADPRVDQLIARLDRIANQVAAAAVAQAISGVTDIAPVAPREWRFTVHRNKDGLIETITALPDEGTVP